MASVDIVRCVELVEDFDIYPRTGCEVHECAEYAENMRAGEIFPPVVADRKTKTITDGWKRNRATMRVNGPEATISVDWRTYGTRAEMLLDSIRMNARHGQRLDTNDRTRCVILGKNLGISMGKVAAALGLPIPKLTEYRNTRIATLRGSGEEVPLKRGIRHMAGKALTSEQGRVNAKLQGVEQSYLANQLIMLLETGLINRGSEKTMATLERLYELLGEFLKK